MSYRRLTDEELYSILGKKPQDLSEINKFVQNNYLGAEAADRLLIAVDSEYNDQTYDNSISYVGVYGPSGELYPKKGREMSVRKDIKNMVSNAGLVPHESSEDYMEDVVVYLKNPELYVKE